MADMKNILSFMYNGEVQVEQDNLLSFLKLAKYLQVKGLTEEKDNVDHEENTEKVLLKEGKNEKKPRIEDTNKSPSGNSLARREDPRARENSRPRSRMMDEIRTRKETASESRLRKEDFELKREDVKEKGENSSLGMNDFETKRDYERAKVKEMRNKEIMKASGKDKILERHRKKKTNNIRKESLGEELKALQAGKSSVKSKERKPAAGHSDINNEENLLVQAMLERKSMLEKISNASLNTFETSHGQDNSFDNDDEYPHPDFDPSLLVKTEIDDTMEEEIDTSASNVPFETSKNNSVSKPTGSWCPLCNKGPIAKMTQHMQNVHSEISYECKTCVKTFKCQRYLQNHKRQYCPERFQQ